MKNFTNYLKNTSEANKATKQLTHANALSSLTIFNGYKTKFKVIKVIITVVPTEPQKMTTKPM